MEQGESVIKLLLSIWKERKKLAFVDSVHFISFFPRLWASLQSLFICSANNRGRSPVSPSVYTSPNPGVQPGMTADGITVKILICWGRSSSQLSFTHISVFVPGIDGPGDHQETNEKELETGLIVHWWEHGWWTNDLSFIHENIFIRLLIWSELFDCLSLHILCYCSCIFLFYNYYILSFILLVFIDLKDLQNVIKVSSLSD